MDLHLIARYSEIKFVVNTGVYMSIFDRRVYNLIYCGIIDTADNPKQR